jgi:hypothetical protein
MGFWGVSDLESAAIHEAAHYHGGGRPRWAEVYEDGSGLAQAEYEDNIQAAIGCLAGGIAEKKYGRYQSGVDSVDVDMARQFIRGSGYSYREVEQMAYEHVADHRSDILSTARKLSRNGRVEAGWRLF